MPKKNRVEVRLDDIDWKCLKIRAENDGITVSEYLRRLIIQHCGK